MVEASPVASAGLFTRGAGQSPVPLCGVSIDAQVSGFCARVSVAHRYVNRESAPIEAVYVFPLDEGAAVCGFEAVVDGRLVVAHVEERDKAFETYDDAIERGHGAFLLDEERPDVFQASVGNLPPGKEVLVRLTYVVELTIDGGRLRFTVPTTVSPRYAPAEDRGGVGRPDSETLNPPVDWRVPYGLDLSVRLSAPGRITAIESPSHPISVALNECSATVTLARQQAALDRDFVLSVESAGLQTPQAMVEHGDDGRQAVAVAFAPVLPEAGAPAEIVFLVDRSGSMGGTSIEEVRNALQLCLRSMTPGCAFNIIGFGFRHEPLFAGSRAYDQQSLDSASRHVAALEANLGGTEILPALQFALDQPRHGELTRQIVVLTDGEVTNTDAVLALAAAHAHDTRVFTFGIGAGASHHLVRGLARAGGGAAEFIFPGERIEPKVVRQFGRLLAPAMGDVRVEWLGAEVTQAPMKVPPVFAGGRLLVYGFASGALPVAARLSVIGSAGPISFEVPIDASQVASGRTVGTLAARARIRELEESGDWLRARGSRQPGRTRSSASKEIVELSVRYGLLSRETSFVAVERREQPVHGDMQLRRVPIALTSGWGGLRDRSGQVASAPLMLGGGFADSEWSAPSMAFDTDSMISACRESTSLLGSAMKRAAGVFDRSSGTERSRQRFSPMDAIVALQAADGSWALNEELADIIGRSLGEIEAALAGASGPREEARRAWATSLALVWLKKHAADRRDEWRLLGEKAFAWIANVSATPPGGGSWTDAARQFESSR